MTVPLPSGRLLSASSIAPQPGEVLHARGAEGSAAAYVTSALLKRGAPTIVLVVATHEEALRVLDDLSSFSEGSAVSYLPALDSTPYDGSRPDRGITLSRAGTLGLLSSGHLDVLVTTARSWIRRVAPAELLRAGTVHLEIEKSMDFEEVAQRLVAGGYSRAPVVEDPGTFAVRGDILDVWPPTSDAPLRLEANFDALGSVRPYNPETQLTLREGIPPKVLGSSDRQIFLPPAREAVLTPESRKRAAEMMQSLCDAVSLPTKKARELIEDVSEGHLFVGSGSYLPAYAELRDLQSQLPKDATFVFHEPGLIIQEIERELEQVRAAQEGAEGLPHFPPEAHYLLEQDLDQTLKGRPVLCLHRSAIAGGDQSGFLALGQAPEDCPHLALSSQSELAQKLEAARRSDGQSALLEPLGERLRAWHEEGFCVVITARLNTQAERIAHLLEHRDFSSVRGPVPTDATDKSGALIVTTSDLSRGLIAPLERLVFLTEEEIFGRRHHGAKRKPQAALAAVLDDLRSLSPGDFVVHVEHGIGRYLGLEHRTVGDSMVELLVVEYQGGDKLMLPVYRLNQIQKFSGEAAPRIDRLGGQTFAKTKATVKKKVRQIADRLLKLYAERKAVKRAPIEPPGDEFAAFEASFPHDETPDQAAAILDVVEDLQKETVMDRLVCGDVGFGKTEVALRAAFLTAHMGRQVALLCPTTVLAEQHLRTFSERFAETGIVVRGMSRFQTKKAQERTLSELRAGQVDVVIGTHRLLSKDVYFKNLGLLVVDEEQRFGVTHKERLKELRRSVDVLTLSATPIPRTLNLAVGGLRDMSVIATAPRERRSIRTITSRFDERVIQSAVRREIERGGQVYYVHNRVEGIYERAALLKRLVPEARVVVGHGQMTERDLEKAMLGFVDGKYDVLCATAIVESGLDIPDANTIIIDRADLFGLSQLYQIRGRVGRSSERAYCYLLVPSDARLSNEARARISALEKYTDLGSGFHIATMDMEIRGAGELLGADQSGFTARVGFELFSQMLEEAAADLRGEEYITEVDPELSIDVEALLPEDYIEDIGIRLSLYKRYALARTEDDIQALDEELKNRFGSAPPAATRFSEVMRIKTQLRRLRALGLSASSKNATMHLREDTPLSPDRLVPFIEKAAGTYRLTPDGRLTRNSTREGSGLDHARRMVQELIQLMDETKQRA